MERASTAYPEGGVAYGSDVRQVTQLITEVAGPTPGWWRAAAQIFFEAYVTVP